MSDFTFTLVTQWDQERTDVVYSSTDSSQGSYQGSRMSGGTQPHLPPLSLSSQPGLQFCSLQTPSLSKDGALWLGQVPSQLPPSQPHEQRELQKPPLYFEFLLCNQFA